MIYALPDDHDYRTYRWRYHVTNLAELNPDGTPVPLVGSHSGAGCKGWEQFVDAIKGNFPLSGEKLIATQPAVDVHNQYVETELTAM